MNCKSCENEIDLVQALEAAPYSWNATGAIWWECLACGTGNHIRFQRDQVAIIVIIGAPGPTWERIQTERSPGTVCLHEPGGLKINYADKWYWIKYR